jgi:hypothetical protein
VTARLGMIIPALVSALLYASSDIDDSFHKRGWWTRLNAKGKPRAIANRRRSIAFDLKIDNLFNYSEPIYYNTILRAPGGNVSTPSRVATPDNFSWIAPRTYTGSVTLSF